VQQKSGHEAAIPTPSNAALLNGEMATSVAALKQRTHGNLLSFGFGDFAYQISAIDHVWQSHYVGGAEREMLA
jgi:hypothetical protein